MSTHLSQGTALFPQLWEGVPNRHGVTAQYGPDGETG